ncbi:DUF6194 family protein [Deinococcus hohokamensis]|uniref:DUF6194 family protein n=1 Tax=Deinococcus hohokamensis TaxID=309883 RepID=A0ABN0VSL0_9DEIO
MDDDAVVILLSSLEGVRPLRADGDTFFLYDPAGALPPEQQRPFATVVTSDRHDQASGLDRPGVYRLNLGLKPETHCGLFGPPPRPTPDWHPVDTGHDFTALDTLMPHPVYAPLGWVCVLNPSAATFKQMQPLLREAHALAARRYAAHAAPQGG